MRTVKQVFYHPVVLQLFNNSGFPDPVYAKSGDSGMDVRAKVAGCVRPGETTLVPTGLYVGIPDGYELQARPRSGLSLKTKIRVANSPGTIDSNYTGELCIIVDNIGESEFSYTAGERIAQIVLQQVPTIVWNPVESRDFLKKTTRGTAGFGSTGTH